MPLLITYTLKEEEKKKNCNIKKREEKKIILLSIEDLAKNKKRDVFEKIAHTTFSIIGLIHKRLLTMPLI